VKFECKLDGGSFGACPGPGATATLSGRRSEVEALRACFVSVTQALALVSLEHRGRALEVLGSAAPRCREAEAAR
jgi:hypothetical protein